MAYNWQLVYSEVVELVVDIVLVDVLLLVAVVVVVVACRRGIFIYKRYSVTILTKPIQLSVAYHYHPTTQQHR